jgi:hypothetical protein
MNWNDPANITLYNREYKRKWTATNPGKIKEKNRRYRERYHAKLRAKFGDDHIIKSGAPAKTIIDGKLQCARCKEWKLVDCFHGDNRKATKRHSWCRQCGTEAARIYREKNREKVRAKQKERLVVYRERRRLLEIVRKYGLSEMELTALRKAQEDKCGSCGVRLTALPAGKGSGWCIDHDHKTGRVRGILCHRCNLLIGMGLDDPDLLRAAASYLERQSNCTAIEQKTKAIG